MKLAIVGSVSLSGREDVYHLIQAVLEGHRPELVVSGGAEGVDSMAVEVAEMLGLAWHEFLPERPGWQWYKKRNLQIATECSQLLRIVASGTKTYGSGWTRDRAAEMGKPTEEITAL